MADEELQESLFSITWKEPPPAPPPHMIIRSRDRRWPDLHLLPDEAFELWNTLADALEERIKAHGGQVGNG